MGRPVALLAEQTLQLHVHPDCVSAAQPWIPLGRGQVGGGKRSAARISVGPLEHREGEPKPPTPPTVHLGTVAAWISDSGARARLRGVTPSTGEIDLAGLDARLELDVEAEPHVRDDAYSMLTLSSALLLGRMERTLIHAAAVATPDGRAWLVVGDGGAGKSTTAIGLSTAEYRLLSDDQVVLGQADNRITVEGWLRPLHVDEGWGTGVPTGQRRTVHPSDLGLSCFQDVGTVVGTLHTRVAAERPTAVSPIPATEAFAGLVRQSPWLLADRGAAESVATVLSETARLPRYAVSLGLDTYGRGPKLRAVLDSILA
jgi:hypothetical protein